jgi:2-dehydropantoate 2-reductase
VAVRFIVYGAGAIGGVVAARLAEHGNEVVAIARGAHADAIGTAGLTLESPDGRRVVRIDVVEHPGEIAVTDDDVVLLAMKSHDTTGALDELTRVAPRRTPVVCLQNGVENERAALRRFENVYGVCVMCPTGHLVPGVVEAYSAPVTGILDVGRYPHGTDRLSEALAGVFGRSTFSSVARADIMRWKHAKLLMNLGNAIEAVCGPHVRRGRLAELVRAEGEACLRAAKIDYATEAEDSARRDGLLTPRPVGGRRRGGGSTWQSLERRAGSVETDYLNGEIVLLGRQHGVATPSNALLQQLAAEIAAAGAPPASITEADILERLGAVDLDVDRRVAGTDG